MSSQPVALTSTVVQNHSAPSQLRTASQVSAPSSTTAVAPRVSTDDTLMVPSSTDDTLMVPSSTAVITVMQLRSFLNRVLQDETVYRQHCDKSFLVGPMQQVGPKLYFNISKRKKDGIANSSTNDKVWLLISGTQACGLHSYTLCCSDCAL
jgi:hypothetical protein